MWRQARRDIEVAGAALGNGFFEWTVFASHQAAEKSLKAVLLAAGDPAPPLHNLDRLFGALVAAGAATPEEQAGLKQALLALTQGWAVSRYPLAGVEMAPADLLTEADARAALTHATAVMDFARSRGIEAA